MRLTLRTLLAYMDGLLDPKDSQEIGKKIEDSKFATELFHKIRDVMRRLRLGAPSITERGANLDCNTVAEYLDNALPGDRVPDFEEVCLKSEMHLAEVASCHQILTMVLGEPVEIEPENRQRMYQLPTVANRGDEERLAAVEAANMLSGDGNAGVPPARSDKTRPRPVVPEYLRDPARKSRLLPAAAIMLLVGAAIGLLLLGLGQLKPGTPVGDAWQRLQAKITGRAADEARDEGDGKRLAKPSADHAVGASGEAAPKSSASGLPAAGSEAAVPAAIDSGNPPATAGNREVPVPVAEKPLEKPIAEKPLADLGKNPRPMVEASQALDSTSPLAGMMTPPNKLGSPEKSPVPSVAAAGSKSAEHGATSPPTQLAGVDFSGVPKTGAAARTGGAARPPLADEEKTKIGRFISDGQDVLLKFEANNSRWRRVLPEEFLASRQPLLALPSYRPRVVVLNIGATLELINGTRIELLPDNAQGQPGVDIDYGRVVIKPLAQAGTRLRLVVGSHTGVLTLTSLESVTGLEVTRVHDPGKDPEKVFSHARTKLYVARGGAVWEEGPGKQAVRLTAPAELMLDGAADAPGTGKDVPKWLTVNTVNELDQRAALSVSQALPADRAASLGLMELVEARQREIRWLAVRCLGYLGQFDPMTAALNDVEFRREWTDYIDQLREAIARGPETAAAVRQSLEKQYGNESAALLYRMLWGYEDKDLEDGEDARLVKFLDHEVPVFRVLAFEALKDITHQGLYYRPESTAAKRLPSVQQWRRQLQLGRIRVNVPEGKPRTAPGELPSKQVVPEPPKPLHAAASNVKAASAAEPFMPGDLPRAEAGAEEAHSRGRLPVSVPEPDPPEGRLPVTVPEP